MNTQKLIASTMAIGGLALFAAGAQAQSFSYTTVFSPNPILSSGDSGNTITVLNGSNPLINAGSFGSNINLSNFVENSNTPPPSAVTFNQDFNIALSITPDGGTVMTKDFTGNIQGKYNTDASMTVTSFTAPSSEVFDFGSLGSYTVNDLGFTPPGPSKSSTQGAIAGFVTYTPGPTAVPEPATIVPFAMGGLALLGLIARKTRRASAASV